MARNVSSSSSLSCLPDEMVLNCLVHVPRRYYENVSCVSERLRSLVRSPELYRMRSLLHKDSVCVCFCDRENYSIDATYLWFTLRWTTMTEYQLVPISLPSHYFMFRSSTVARGGFHQSRPSCGSLIPDLVSYVRARSSRSPALRSATLWEYSAKDICNTRLETRRDPRAGLRPRNANLESRRIPVPDEKLNTKPMMASSVSLEGKVYAMHVGSIIVYNLRQGRRKEKLEMPTDDWVWCMCVADNVLFAFFTKCGLMWLDTERNVWRVVTGDVQTLHRKLYGSAMAGYYGKLALFWRERDIGTTTTTKTTTKKKKKEEEIWCSLIALERVEDGIRGTIEWFGVVATIPYVCRFLHCLVASD